MRGHVRVSRNAVRIVGLIFQPLIVRRIKCASDIWAKPSGRPNSRRCLFFFYNNIGTGAHTRFKSVPCHSLWTLEMFHGGEKDFAGDKGAKSTRDILWRDPQSDRVVVQLLSISSTSRIISHFRDIPGRTPEENQSRKEKEREREKPFFFKIFLFANGSASVTLFC